MLNPITGKRGAERTQACRNFSENSVAGEGSLETSEDILAKCERWETRIRKRGGIMNLLKLTRENNRTGELSAGKGLK